MNIIPILSDASFLVSKQPSFSESEIIFRLVFVAIIYIVIMIIVIYYLKLYLDEWRRKIHEEEDEENNKGDE